MDYEKDNLLSETRDNWRIGYAKKLLAFGVSEECRSALEKEFPELKENEDEKIRNEIIAFIEQAIHSGGGTIIPEEKEDRWIAYLEKQKDNAEKEYVFRPLAGTDINIAAKHAIEMAKDGDHLVLAFNGMYTPVSKYDSAKGLVDKYNTYLKEQKPAEWSEEDKVMLNNIIWAVHMKFIMPFDEMDDKGRYKKYEDFLKSLPTRFSSQPHWKPSEKEIEALSWAINYLTDIEQGCASTLALLKFNLKEML